MARMPQGRAAPQGQGAAGSAGLGCGSQNHRSKCWTALQTCRAVLLLLRDRLPGHRVRGSPHPSSHCAPAQPGCLKAWDPRRGFRSSCYYTALQPPHSPCSPPHGPPPAPDPNRKGPQPRRPCPHTAGTAPSRYHCSSAPGAPAKEQELPRPTPWKFPEHRHRRAGEGPVTPARGLPPPPEPSPPGEGSRQMSRTNAQDSPSAGQSRPASVAHGAFPPGEPHVLQLPVCTLSSRGVWDNGPGLSPPEQTQAARGGTCRAGAGRGPGAGLAGT